MLRKDIETGWGWFKVHIGVQVGLAFGVFFFCWYGVHFYKGVIVLGFQGHNKESWGDKCFDSYGHCGSWLLQFFFYKGCNLFRASE